MKRIAFLIAATAAAALGACQRTPATNNVLRDTRDDAENILDRAQDKIENFSDRAGTAIENGFRTGVNEVRDAGRDIGGGNTQANASRNESRR